MNGAKVFVQGNNFAFEASPEDDHHIYEDGVESEEDGPVVVRRSVGLNRASLPPSDYAKHTPSKANGLDGYDAFENTNNKKKRKIPTSGSLGGHSTLSADLLNMSPTSPNGPSLATLEDSSTGNSYYGSANPTSPAGSGFSGPGRGRFGRNAARSAGNRTPLANSPNNAWLNRSGGGRREDHNGIDPFPCDVYACGF